MTTVVKQPAVETLRASLRGELILPGDEGYEGARKVHNGMIDRRPRFIVRPANVRDVISAVNFARENELTLAVRGGSHSVPGFGVCDDGLVIDLSRMKGIRVDPEESHRAGRGRMHLGRRRSRHPCLRAGGAGRRYLHNGHRRPHAGRRHRLPRSQVRPVVRQPDLGGRGDRRRSLRHRQRRGERGSLLGAARRQRQLRRRDLVRVQGAPGEHGLRRGDTLPTWRSREMPCACIATSWRRRRRT